MSSRKEVEDALDAAATELDALAGVAGRVVCLVQASGMAVVRTNTAGPHSAAVLAYTVLSGLAEMARGNGDEKLGSTFETAMNVVKVAAGIEETNRETRLVDDQVLQ